MTKIKSGLILIAIGIGLNIFINRLVTFYPVPTTSLLEAGAATLLMVLSVVLVMFGIFGMAFGLLSRKRVTTHKVTPAGNTTAVADDTVWPPAPKPPDAA